MFIVPYCFTVFVFWTGHSTATSQACLSLFWGGESTGTTFARFLWQYVQWAAHASPRFTHALLTLAQALLTLAKAGRLFPKKISLLENIVQRHAGRDRDRPEFPYVFFFVFNPCDGLLHDSVKPVMFRYHGIMGLRFGYATGWRLKENLGRNLAGA